VVNIGSETGGYGEFVMGDAKLRSEIMGRGDM